MSMISTFKFSVYADSFEEIKDKAELEVAMLLGIDVSEIVDQIRYELVVMRDDDMGADFTYKADVIARLK
jgi:hypothetical protein